MVPSPSVSGPAARIEFTSFRDPCGVLFAFEGRILRLVNSAGTAELQAFLGSRTARQLEEEGQLVTSRFINGADAEALLADPRFRQQYDAIQATAIIEHERVAFPSFPHEWPAEMLHAAADLTLNIALTCLKEDLGLKDATPLNVLFRGPDPVFVDLLSFEGRDPGDPTWLPYAQFVRTFLLPLLVNKYFGLPLDQILMTRRDGLEPEEVYKLLRPLQKIRRPFLGLVTIPTNLASRHNQDDQSIYRKRTLDSAEKARFIVLTLLKSLRRTLRRLEPRQNIRSVWSDYMASNNNYSAEQFANKETFIKRTIAEHGPKRVLDVGCNTGHFSALAARSGAAVVAIDYDPVVVGSVWRNALREHLNILPLVVNLARPSPGLGWLNHEWPSFLDRAKGSFDLVMMLAVLHHMLVTERVPLARIVDLAAELTTDLLIIEFIEPDDSMFRRLVRGREDLHRDLTTAAFEQACSRRFDLVQSERVHNAKRALYLLKKKT